MLTPFKEDHPLFEFNKDFYIESGREKEPIYIFKFGDIGAQVVLDMKRYDEPFAFLFELIFDDGYNWHVNTERIGKCIQGRTFEDVLEGIRKELQKLKYGEQTVREDS